MAMDNNIRPNCLFLYGLWALFQWVSIVSLGDLIGAFPSAPFFLCLPFLPPWPAMLHCCPCLLWCLLQIGYFAWQWFATKWWNLSLGIGDSADYLPSSQLCQVPKLKWLDPPGGEKSVLELWSHWGREWNWLYWLLLPSPSGSYPSERNFSLGECLQLMAPGELYT